MDNHPFLSQCLSIIIPNGKLPDMLENSKCFTYTKDLLDMFDRSKHAKENFHEEYIKSFQPITPTRSWSNWLLGELDAQQSCDKIKLKQSRFLSDVIDQAKAITHSGWTDKTLKRNPTQLDGTGWGKVKTGTE